MLYGVSTASLYPMHTEDAVKTLGGLGVKNIEIFINDLSETQGEIAEKIIGAVKEYDMRVFSVHPFSSPMETLFMFSDYDRRRATFLEIYKHYFELTQRLGARFFVLHGAGLNSRCTDEFYFEQYIKLCEAAEGFGVTVSQENVAYCKSARIDFLRKLKEKCEGKARFVLDIKQAVRSGVSPSELIDVLGSDITHVHVSDNREKADCLPIGKGTFDLKALKRKCIDAGIDGAMLIELYRNNYGEPEELVQGVKFLSEI